MWLENLHNLLMEISDSSPNSKPIKLIYIIGRYPELTTTFIEREISALQQIGDFHIQTVSLRYPLTPEGISPEHQAIRCKTLYLVPKNWRNFDFLAFIGRNLYFMFSRPRVYWGTLIYLLTHQHPNYSSRLMTLLHFSLGVHAAGILRKLDFDHLHVHFIDRSVVVALVASRLLKKTYSLTAHAADIYTKQILIQEKLINARFVVTVSQYNKMHFINSYSNLDPQNISVLHPWVDMSSFNPNGIREKRSGLHILSVGRLVEKKGHADLVKACHLLQQQGIDFECRIVGEGALKQNLTELIKQHELGERVHLIGAQPQSLVRQLLESWCDVFALPCVISRDGDRDGIPVSLAEAMAMKLPVISTDILGIGELVQPGTGILIPPGNPVALANALQQLKAAGPEILAEMGMRGRQIVDAEFNLFKGTGQLAKLFREVVA
jgi:colanic acid/amylovoran biosynthesis glycosyltransferase